LPLTRADVRFEPKEVATIKVFPLFDFLGGLINGSLIIRVSFLILAFIFLPSIVEICSLQVRAGHQAISELRGAKTLGISRLSEYRERGQPMPICIGFQLQCR